jgi:hypothetical protein
MSHQEGMIKESEAHVVTEAVVHEDAPEQAGEVVV